MIVQIAEIIHTILSNNNNKIFKLNLIYFRIAPANINKLKTREAFLYLFHKKTMRIL